MRDPKRSATTAIQKLLSATLYLFGSLLGQFLCEQESQALFSIEEHIHQAAKDRCARPKPADILAAKYCLIAKITALDPKQARTVAAAFALYFDLVNLADELPDLAIELKTLLANCCDSVAAKFPLPNPDDPF